MSGERTPEKDAFYSALITEGISLAVMLMVLYALGHKMEIEHAWWRLRHRGRRRVEADARALREVRSEISRLEHPEAT